jgi:hypothetical protein
MFPLIVEPAIRGLTVIRGEVTVYVTPAMVTVAVPLNFTFALECRCVPTSVTLPVTVAVIPVGTPEGEVWVIVNVNVSLVAVPGPDALKVPRLTKLMGPLTAHPAAQSVAATKLIPVVLVAPPVEVKEPDVVNDTVPADAKADSTSTHAAIRILLFFTFTPPSTEWVALLVDKNRHVNQS